MDMFYYICVGGHDDKKEPDLKNPAQNNAFCALIKDGTVSCSDI